MSGVLLSSEIRLFWFALPHALALLALGRWLTPKVLHRWLLLSTIGTALLTVFYAFQGAGVSAVGAAVTLLVLGLVAAPLSIQFGVFLGGARWPVAAAAVGLCLGNLGSMLLEAAPGSAVGKLVLLACLLQGGGLRASPSLAPSHDGSKVIQTSPMPLWRFLPFVVLFQTVSGLMYSQLWPGYREQVVWPGVELLAYVCSVLLVMRFVARHGLRCVLGAVGLAVASFAVHHAASGVVGQHLSLFLMLAAAGVVDLVLLSEVLARANRIRAYGYTVGVMVLGIVLGEILVMSLKVVTLPMALVALVLLNLATAALFLQRNEPRNSPVASVQTVAQVTETSTNDSAPPALPARITDLLSEQELRVLQAALENQPYRTIAQTFGISESSVKTYMQRIYRKLGIYRRGQLAELLADEGEVIEPIRSA